MAFSYPRFAKLCPKSDVVYRIHITMDLLDIEGAQRDLVGLSNFVCLEYMFKKNHLTIHYKKVQYLPGKLKNGTHTT